MEKLCIFCEHFKWRRESVWGMGSTLTGPMMTGGFAECDLNHFSLDHRSKDFVLTYPEDESDYRKIIMRGLNCDDYQQVDIGKEK